MCFSVSRFISATNKGVDIKVKGLYLHSAKLFTFFKMSNKTILYTAMSSDGFLAGENDNIDFLSPYQVEGEDYGYNEFIKSVGAIIVGRKTYEIVIGMGYPYHPDKNVYVATRGSIKSDRENLFFYNGDMKALIKQLKSSQHKNIYCDGGAALAKSLFNERLIDEIILSVIPVKLEKGIMLFDNGIIPNDFKLKGSKEFKTGLIQYYYELQK